MLHLFRLQVSILVFLFALLNNYSNAQPRTDAFNYLEFKNKPYYFGIAMGYAASDYRIQHSKDFIRNEEFIRAESISGPGLRIGVIGNLKFGEYFDFRIVPGFAFTERFMDYRVVGQEQLGDLKTERIESTFFEFPMLFRYKSQPYQDFRVFMLGGVKYSYDISNRSRTEQAGNLILTASHDYAVEFGVGVQIFFPYFIFSPQIKVSHGLGNIHLYNGALEKSNVIESINSRMISITFNFEG